MGFNRRKMEDQRREAAGKEAATRRATDAQVLKVGVESLQRVVPVVITGDRIDRLRKALEREIKIRLIIMHRSSGIDDIRGYQEELHIIAQPKLQIPRDQ